jgi:DNA-binding NarL/FixJ family response regulator
MVRDPMIIAAFTQLFDRAFDRALPVGPDDQQDDDDQRLLKLLGLGLKDESIARYLGCSLRTVRRRVAGLMARHGVQTRFQLGMAASSGGLGSAAEGARSPAGGRGSPAGGRER